MAIAYAARCYLRLSSLLPHSCDLKQVGRDVEALAATMASCKSTADVTHSPDPGLQVSEHLRDVVSKARRSHELPPSTQPSSPTLYARNFADQIAAYQLSTHSDFAFDQQATSDEVLGTDFEWNQGWDFSLVDQLFSTVTGPAADTGRAGPAFWDR